MAYVFCVMFASNDSQSALPPTAQIVLFSATFPEHVSLYSRKFAKDPNEIKLQHEELTVDGIKQLYIDCNNEEEKYNNLVQLYGVLTIGSSIIFVRVSTQRFPTASITLTNHQNLDS